MQQRKSGLLVPDDAEPEVCPHPDAEVDRRHSGYKCRRCKQGVYLVTVQTKFMTGEEIIEAKREAERALKQVRVAVH